MDYMVKVKLKHEDSLEYITDILVRDAANKDQAEKIALDNCKRKPWLKLSEQEISRLVVTEIKTY